MAIGDINSKGKDNNVFYLCNIFLTHFRSIPYIKSFCQNMFDFVGKMENWQYKQN